MPEPQNTSPDMPVVTSPMAPRMAGTGILSVKASTWTLGSVQHPIRDRPSHLLTSVGLHQSDYIAGMGMSAATFAALSNICIPSNSLFASVRPFPSCDLRRLRRWP
jgi:hypothetical protein